MIHPILTILPFASASMEKNSLWSACIRKARVEQDDFHAQRWSLTRFPNLNNSRGTYRDLVDTIRRRDLQFQGSINPMVLAHGDVWESIQYSGRESPDSWKCPFHFMKHQNKPL